MTGLANLCHMLGWRWRLKQITIFTGFQLIPRGIAINPTNVIKANDYESILRQFYITAKKDPITKMVKKLFYHNKKK